MLRILPPILRAFPAFLLILQFFTFAAGQDIDVRITITAAKESFGHVRASFTSGAKPGELWFMDDYAGLTGLLTRRLSTVNLYDKQGYLIARKRFMPSDRIKSSNIGGFGYSVDLKPMTAAFAAAHVSWANEGGGLLMLDDLLPQSLGKRARLKLDLPAGWKVFTTETETEQNIFDVSNIEKAVFYLGPNVRETRAGAKKSPPILSITGEWLFTDTEAAAMAEAIFGEYRRTLGPLPDFPRRISINKFPVPGLPGNWEADTRGRSVTIISSDMPFKSQSLQRLHEQLRHELFHLWIPNGVNLSGNYDWFYEGFALYQSLKMGVGVNRLRFEDFLDTLSRAYDIDGSAKPVSLIDASRNRWNGSNTQVYARGMLVAFLCDLALLSKSKGKLSATRLAREVYEKHGITTAPTDGNAAVLGIFRSHAELIPIIERYILGTESLEWNALLNAAGIESGPGDRPTRLSVSSKLSGRQKDILDKLGYNNWRKISGKQ